MNPFLLNNFSNICSENLETFNQTKNTNTHVFIFDEESKSIFSNSLQLNLINKIMDTKKDDLYGLSVNEIYKMFPQKAEQIIKENELVLKNKIPHHFYSTLVIPNYTKINFLTVKIPQYDPKSKKFQIFGIACYLSQMNLEIAEQYSLTMREIDCIELFLEGKSAKTIAGQLNLSPRTIEFYLDNIKGKLDCNNKNELMLKLKKLGIKTCYR